MAQEQEQKPQAQTLVSAEIHAKFNQGKALHQQGKLPDAERLYREVLRQKPNHFGALHLLGVIALQTRQTKRGADLIRKAIALNANIASAHSNLGKALLDLELPEEAIASCDTAIALKPDFAEAHYNRGNALSALKRPKEALVNYDRAIALAPGFAEAYYTRGKVLMELGRLDEALASYDRTVRLKPYFAEAFNNRGLALINLQRPEEALASYDKAIALKPIFPEAYTNRGLALASLRQHQKALESYKQAIRFKADFAKAHNNRGLLLNALKRNDEALLSYNRAIACQPDFVEAYINRAVALRDLKRFDESLANYSKAIGLNRDYEYLYGVWLHAKMMISDWSNFDTDFGLLTDKIKRGEKASLPFPFLSVSDNLEQQKRVSEIWTLANCPENKTLQEIPKRSRNDKIRIGYFSADFHDHATAHLMAGLFESHDRSRFEPIAFSFGPDANNEMRQRLIAAFDKFIDVRTYSDKDIAVLARQFGLDIAIDLKGFTADGRPGIFAFRAAPIQVSYLGYPGTMAADYIDYLIADATLIPKTSQSYYTEKIIYLPNSYQVNDSKRFISNRVFTRIDAGLPDDGFVFCCFNNNYKITPSVFDIWMRILTRVEGSLLWLLEDNAIAAINLRKEAKARGVDPDRLVFAKRMTLPDHLARHRLADLFLDTLPYNAHTTASDALWTGLPVLTQIGNTFAGRVAASLLNAIGLPELITSTPQAFEDRAIELATDCEKLAVIKGRLATNRLTTPLFDTSLFTDRIEAAYSAIYERYQADLAPDHIYF